MDIHRAAFKEEARELLEELESSLLDLEKIPDDADIIGRVFRAMHTIKGSGAMFGFDDVAAFTHHIETVFDAVRNGKISVSKPLIDLTLSACDEIRTMVLETKPDEPTSGTQTCMIVEAFRAFVPEPDPPLKSASRSKPFSH